MKCKDCGSEHFELSRLERIGLNTLEQAEEVLEKANEWRERALKFEMLLQKSEEQMDSLARKVERNAKEAAAFQEENRSLRQRIDQLENGYCL